MADLKIDSELKEQINAFTKAYKVLKPDKEKLTEDLAARGWFFNHSNLPGFWVTVLYHVKKGDFEILDQIFCDLYEVEKDEIFSRLMSFYPEIELNLSEAKFCIDNHKYYAAIPLLLSLAEYLANVNISLIKGEETTHVLFKRKNSINALDKLLGAELIRFNQFSYNSSLTKNHSFIESQADSDKTKINRHSVLHGCDITYGTRINALKTLCFINHVDLTLRAILK